MSIDCRKIFIIIFSVVDAEIHFTRQIYLFFYTREIKIRVGEPNGNACVNSADDVTKFFILFIICVGLDDRK